jgi:hypothetical protein
VSSIAGVRALARALPYSAVKAALINYTARQALALAPKHIRVNAIAPGSVEFPGGTWDQRRTSQPELYQATLETRGVDTGDRKRLPKSLFSCPVIWRAGSPDSQSSWTVANRCRIGGRLEPLPCSEPEHQMTQDMPAAPLTRDLIVGSWRMVSWVTRDIETGEQRDALGPNPDGVAVYSPERVFVPDRDERSETACTAAADGAGEARSVRNDVRLLGPLHRFPRSDRPSRRPQLERGVDRNRPSAAGQTRWRYSNDLLPSGTEPVRRAPDHSRGRLQEGRARVSQDAGLSSGTAQVELGSSRRVSPPILKIVSRAWLDDREFCTAKLFTSGSRELFWGIQL